MNYITLKKTVFLNIVFQRERVCWACLPIQPSVACQNSSDFWKSRMNILHLFYYIIVDFKFYSTELSKYQMHF